MFVRYDGDCACLVSSYMYHKWRGEGGEASPGHPSVADETHIVLAEMWVTLYDGTRPVF